MGTSADTVRLALRKLWSDHVIWTREYIVAAVAGTPDASAAAGRLLKNQEDIGAAVVPLMFAAGLANLAGIAALAATMGYEAVVRHGARAASGAGVALLALAVVVVATGSGPLGAS